MLLRSETFEYSTAYARTGFGRQNMPEILEVLEEYINQYYVKITISNSQHMNQRLAHITIVVDDYDKAIEFYTQKLHFDLTEDTALPDGKRWVLVTPKGAKECSLLLAKADNEAQKNSIGKQTGGRVFLFLYTDNFERDYQNLLNHNIKIVRAPSTESFGTVVVFEDIFGNLWDLIEPIK